MSQHDYDIANQTRSSFRSDLNAVLAAIVSQNSGATEPATKFAYQWWADTTTGLLKIRNAANNAWVTVGTLASANLGLALVGGSASQAFSALSLDVGNASDTTITRASAGTLAVEGVNLLTTATGLLNGVLSKSAAYSAVAADRGKLIDCTTGTWSLTLLAAATAGDGFAFAVRNSGSGVITIDPNASELVDGAATIVLNAGESCLLVCDGTGWKTIGRPVGIGYGQTWQDVTVSRTFGGAGYTNSTGRPICVNIDINLGNTTTQTYITVDGVKVSTTEGYSAGTYTYALSAIVPNGSTYVCVQGAASSIDKWVELR